LPSNALHELLKWRRQKESLFSFDTNRALSQTETHDAERLTQNRTKSLRDEAAKVEVKLNEAVSRTQIKMRSLESKIYQLARKIDQAKTDLKTLELELKRA
jgi:DNA-binding helix-hairpin-helix protein with protein kinase domain